ncbi:MAG: InlB B-repeat-containing protein, partial [Clostridia bacterium]|nr:InlB B-repeat-containing protein [Clostridia bacterium]
MTFVDKDGKVLVVMSVLAGAAIGELPEAPEVEGRAFIGWYTELGQHVYSTTKVNGMMRVIARYEGDDVGTDILPAQSFEYTTAHNVTVRASVPEGVFPEGTTMRVTDVDEDKTRALALTKVSASELTDAVAVDITFYDANGFKIEPKDQNKVHVKINTNRKMEGDSFTLYHEIRDGVLQAMGNASPYGADFESASFSVYIVVGTGGDAEYARIKVLFHRMKADGNNEADAEAVEILVKPKDLASDALFQKVVFDPGPGTMPDGYLFHGWSKTASWNATTTKLSFDAVRADIRAELEKNTDDDTTNDFVDMGVTLHYYATAFESRTVTYYDQDKAALKADIVLLDSNHQATYTISQAYTLKLTTQAFMGWTTSVPSTSDGVTYTYSPAVNSSNLWDVGTEITVTENKVFYPYIQTGYWLIFDNNIDQDDDPTKGAYISPVFYPNGTNTASPTNPTPSRPGYTLEGWYLDAAMTQPFSFGGQLSADTTIYAKWTPDETSYRVVFMVQNASDAADNDATNNTYSYYDSIIRTKRFNY